MTVGFLTEKEVGQLVELLLKSRVEETEIEWAKARGIWPTGLTDYLHGRISPPSALLKALGLRKKTVYERVKG